jgi:hypothetical protein
MFLVVPVVEAPLNLGDIVHIAAAVILWFLPLRETSVLDQGTF